MNSLGWRYGKKGQNLIEYAILLALIVGIGIFMYTHSYPFISVYPIH